VREKELYFTLSRNPGEKVTFDQLSSGEKSILVIISTIFGYDLENGLLIIDEPELHLHPQMQRDLMFFITRICKLKKIQCIIATHSPLMINEHTIHNVYRCSWNIDHTQINAPKFRIHKDEADLIQMLRYSYSAKIFFSKRIILVE
jgi:predicted ATP-dependent endonuclease of OLD family